MSWKDLAELIKEYGAEKGTEIFLYCMDGCESIKRQVDELEYKK